MLLSHGIGSSLREHLLEVCSVSECIEEKIIYACHDIGKATIEWQRYIIGSILESPHYHASSGGLLASLVIKHLGRKDSVLWAGVALHVGSAHHSNLSIISGINSVEFCKIASDKQAKRFFLDKDYGIASILSEIPIDILESAWEDFYAIAPGGPKSTMFQNWLRLDGDKRMDIFFIARLILGKLCFQDHTSASKQSGKTKSIVHWERAFPNKKLQKRTAKIFSKSTGKIAELRRFVSDEFVKCAEYNSIFYLIDAPTGLGKTEAMLRCAEMLIERYGLSQVVYSVPQISIADQIYEEYFDRTNDNIQIWNFIRQEKTSSKKIEELIGFSPSFEAEIAIQPFSESYNITTFNQVLFAMFHPSRMRCIKGLGLKNSVIIMDEFHKLPFIILPYFFKMATAYAKIHNCKFILGSATPIEEYEYLGLNNASRIPCTVTAPVYKDDAVDNRRIYLKKGMLTCKNLVDNIEEFHSKSEQNLLVVVNLVGKGSWTLLKHFYANYDPWTQLEQLNVYGTSRLVVFLDGLLPPMLRREIVRMCKKRMTERPITLITTSMIEVGVDLDFDYGMVDFNGLASMMQRGGRVGREGRGTPCVVEVFCLCDETGQTSFQLLSRVLEKTDVRFKLPAFKGIADKIISFARMEMDFFVKWRFDEPMRDFQIATKLLEIQKKFFMCKSPDDLLDKLFYFNAYSDELGYNFVSGQYLSELYESDYGTDVILFKDTSELDKFNVLVGELRTGLMTYIRKKELNRFVVDRKIIVSDEKIIDAMGMLKHGTVEEFDDSLILVRK